MSVRVRSFSPLGMAMCARRMLPSPPFGGPFWIQ
jgi:hypothetical protein